MRELNLHPYILLGDSIRFLRNVHEGMPIKRKVDPNDSSVDEHLTRIYNEMWVMDLPVTQEALQGELGDIGYEFYELPDGSDATLSGRQADSIHRGILLICDILKYESSQLRAYIITEKRLPIKRLLSEVRSLFGEDVFDVLPDMAQYDFRQAGRCIALEVPTAAAFHMLRGTESVLRSYYSALVQPIAGFINWSQLVAGLRGVSTDQPPRELLDNLDNIRVSFRNPTQHPEKVYDLDEAQDLFNLCVDAVNRMAKDLLRRGVWKVLSF